MNDNTLKMIDQLDKINQSTADAIDETRTAIKLDVFKQTGIKVDDKDAVIDLIILVSEQIKSLSNQLNQQLEFKYKGHLDEFDRRIEELNQLLSKLENQKDAIVADVWQKLDKRVADKVHNQVHSDLSQMAADIAKGANNQINNQRNMLVGGIGGLLVGLLLCAVLVFLFK